MNQEAKQELSQVHQVEEFMRKSLQPVRYTPEFPPNNEIEFRLRLILEEVTELAEACGSDVYSSFGRMLFHKSQDIHYNTEKARETLKPNIVKVLDALKDIQYVTLGTEVAFGLQDVSEDAFNEVHSSNMSKFCITEEQAQETVRLLNESGDKEKSPAHFINPSPNHYIIQRDGDNKVMKSKDYRPANLEQFISISNGN